MSPPDTVLLVNPISAWAHLLLLALIILRALRYIIAPGEI